MDTRRKLAAGAGAAAVLGPAAYLLFFRRWCLTWGACYEEITAKLPGDELLADAGLVTTRAVTVDAPPEAVWPWLAQMGSGRGGAYSYDWIENLLGLNMHSASEILPEYQDIKAGDALPLGSRGPTMEVKFLDRPRALAFRSSDRNWAWIFALLPQEDGSTRLVSRNRIGALALPPAGRLFYRLLMEPGSLVMERKMLLGIKERAERARPRQARLPSPGAWHRLAGLGKAWTGVPGTGGGAMLGSLQFMSPTVGCLVDRRPVGARRLSGGRRIVRGPTGTERTGTGPSPC